MAVAKQARSFGGFFLDSTGALVLYVADTAEFVQARAAVSSLLAAGTVAVPQAALARMQVRKGDYSYQQLSDWRDIVSDSLLNQPGVTFDDLDEARNRVTIGLDETQFASLQIEVGAALDRLSIPRAAVHFQPSGIPILATSALTLPQDSSGGGVAIDMKTQSGTYFGTCSLGFVADSVGVPTLFTGSHCGLDPI